MLVVMVGCGGQAKPTPDASSIPALPGPQELSRPHQASAAVLYLDGSAYDAAVAQHVNAVSTYAVLTPQDAGAEPQIATMAYGLYRFNTEERTGPLQLSLEWSSAKPDNASCWLAFADWERDRWDWLAPPTADGLELDGPQIARYSKTGTHELLCVVALTGSESANLFGLGFEKPEPAAGQWPMLGHDPQHTFRSDYRGSQTGNLKWTFRTFGRGNVFYKPAVALDGTIYACDEYYLCAYSPDGDILWRLSPPGTGRYYLVAVDHEGTILSFNTNGSLYALNPDGSEKWEYSGWGSCGTAPVIGADNAIYLMHGSGTKGIVAINPDGTERWRSPYGSDGAPAVAEDGTVYVSGGESSGLHALDANGQLLWTCPISYPDDVVICPDGSLICADGQGYINSVTATGELNWSHRFDGTNTYTAPPVVDAGGMVYVAYYNYGQPAALYAVTPTGELSWSYEVQRGFDAVTVATNGNILALTHQGDVDQPPAALMCFDNSGNVNWIYDDIAATHPRGVHLVPMNGLVALPDGGALTSSYLYGALHRVSADGSRRWVCGAGGQVQWNPVIDQIGNVYFGCTDGTLYSVSPEGELLWHYEVPGTEMQCPTVVDNVIYDAACNQELGGPWFALNRDGTLKWNITLPEDAFMSSPIAGSGGLVLLSAQDHVYAASADGALQWDSWAHDGRLDLICPAVALDGAIRIGSYGDPAASLYALNATGAQQWVYTPAAEGCLQTYGPAIGADGTAYTCANQKLYALNPDGSVKWIYTSPQWLIEWAPALAADGTIYIKCGYGIINAVNPDGTSKWEFQTEGETCGTPAVDAEGTVYFCSSDRYLYCVDASGQLKWKQLLDAYPYSHTFFPYMYSPAIAADGTVYVGAGNLLYAFGD